MDIEVNANQKRQRSGEYLGRVTFTISKLVFASNPAVAQQIIAKFINEEYGQVFYVSPQDIKVRELSQSWEWGQREETQENE